MRSFLGELEGRVPIGSYRRVGHKEPQSLGPTGDGWKATPPDVMQPLRAGVSTCQTPLGQRAQISQNPKSTGLAGLS